MLKGIYEMYSLEKYTIETTLINVFVAVVMLTITYYLYKNKNVLLEDIVKGAFLWSVLGLSIRFLEDVFYIEMPLRFLFITPFIYVETYIMAVMSYLILKSIHIDKRVWYYLPLFLSLPVYAFIIMEVKTFRILPALVILLIVVFLFYILNRIYKELQYSLPITFQTFDGLTTFVAVTFLNFYEEQLLATKIISFAENYLFVVYGSGAWLFLLLKFFISLAIVEYIKRHRNTEKEAHLVLWFIAFLGFVTGFRNLLNILFV